MEPSRCSVLVVDRSCTEHTYQPSQISNSVNSRSSNPFLANSGDRCTCEANNNQDVDDLIKIFLSIFSEVITVPSGTKAINTLRNREVGCPPTILLIDIDHTESVSRDLYARRESFLVMDGVSLSEIHTTKDTLYGLELLKYVNSEISKGKLERVIPIVCSFNENSEFMLECLNKGAVDYLLKPIRPEVAKTIFLHVHRSNISPPRSASSIEYPRAIIRNFSNLEERLDEIFAKDKWLTNAIIQYYTPSSVSLDIPSFPRLNSASEIERTNVLKKKLTEWEFDSHKLSEDDLMRCVVIIFEHAMELDELRELNISTDALHRFLLAIRQAYHDSNPYHNFTHAVDVLQAIFFFLCEMNLLPSLFSGYKRQSKSSGLQRPNDLLRSSDVFALLLASIGHDVGHPGVNNDFLIQSQTPLAQLYNDKSVLESFHVMTLFNLMQKYGFKIYDSEPPCETKYSEFRKIVVNAILATDMQLHNNYVKDIKEQTLRFKSTDFDPYQKLAEEKSIIIGALIKCADISNTARPYHIAKSWSNVLLQEFSCQGNLERKLGLPVAPVNDGRVSQPDSQIGFIDYCAMPLFKIVSELIPEIEFTLRYLELNRKTWNDKKETESDNCSLRHNGSVNLDNRQNSPIVVPAARAVPYLRPMPDGPGSEAHSDDCGKSLNRDDILSTAEASDVPFNQQAGGRSRRKSLWSFFAKNMRKVTTNNNNSVDNNSDYHSHHNNEANSSVLCCNIQ
ncbi:hypothetical protein RclHR1_08560001 [Rhizophagus clarus]|uniref:Phosphodiesterase n=1 Tax=Rhizophagus clarus TaxID=94130 RepID=A0A2Z6SC69_9GLOM|nr:hypothetical protein RclHR1_08560001 [Rhizophagus clarus]